MGLTSAWPRCRVLPWLKFLSCPFLLLITLGYKYIFIYSGIRATAAASPSPGWRSWSTPWPGYPWSLGKNSDSGPVPGTMRRMCGGFSYRLCPRPAPHHQIRSCSRYQTIPLCIIWYPCCKASLFLPAPFFLPTSALIPALATALIKKFQ